MNAVVKLEINGCVYIGYRGGDLEYHRVATILPTYSTLRVQYHHIYLFHRTIPSTVLSTALPPVYPLQWWCTSLQSFNNYPTRKYE